MGSLVKHRTQETGRERCKQRRWIAVVTTEVRTHSDRAGSKQQALLY